MLVYGYLLACLHVVPAARADLKVNSAFPNGSGHVESIDQATNTIRLVPTPYENRGWQCWWYIHVTGIRSGDDLSIEVGPVPWATPRYATFSLDNQNWQQTSFGQRRGTKYVYSQRIIGSEAWFAWGPPFTVDDAQRLIGDVVRRLPNAESFVLCRTREGRQVPALRLVPEGAPSMGIWIQARQHAWESGSSWVCRGLVEWLASGDPLAARLRDNAVITVVPIMDVDSVSIGAGGKNQTPHDHNRDWSHQPHFPSVAAAIEQISSLDRQKKFDLFIDLHNPGPSDQHPFFYLTPRQLLSEWANRNVDRFLAAAKHEITGPLEFRGERRESGAGYDRNWKRISKNWVSMNTRPHVVSVTLETSWNTEHSTVDGYHAVGRQLGRAIERYRTTSPRVAP